MLYTWYLSDVSLWLKSQQSVLNKGTQNLSEQSQKVHTALFAKQVAFSCWTNFLVGSKCRIIYLFKWLLRCLHAMLSLLNLNSSGSLRLSLTYSWLSTLWFWKLNQPLQHFCFYPSFHFGLLPTRSVTLRTLLLK